MSPDYKELRRMKKGALPFAVYKGVNGKYGALRLGLKKAFEDHIKEYGCVFLEMAPTTGPNQYDWKNQKIIMKLDLPDIGKIIYLLENPTFLESQQNGASIYHDPGAGGPDRGKSGKNLNIYKSKDMNNFFFTLNQKVQGVETVAKVPVAPSEAIVIVELLKAAIPAIVSWGAPASTEVEEEERNDDTFGNKGFAG